MSVYKHIYRPYAGRLTPLPTRVLVLARYGLREAWSSKITVAIATLGMLPFVVFLVGIYLANNPVAQMLIFKGRHADSIDADFFFKVLATQAWFGLVLGSWIAPRLISFDLADNALPILLSHPISRVGYISGKLVALLASLSLMTWVPCLVLFAFQAYSSARPWGVENLSIAGGMLAGGVIWIVFLSLLGLALSSWVKWRVVATGSIFAALLVPAGIGTIVSAVLRTKWGYLLNAPFLMGTLARRLLGLSEADPRRVLPTFSIAAALIVACFLFAAMLNARIRARGVVKG